MASRLKLHKVLVTLSNVKKVYFQPPSTVKMDYPCIVYELDEIDSIYANNSKYINTKKYQLTIIDKNPDSTIPDEVLKFPLCKLDRLFSSDGLNHWVFNLYF